MNTGSSGNRVKEEESEANVLRDSPRKRLPVWAGSSAAHPKGEGAFGLRGQIWPEGQVQLKKVQKDPSARQG